MTKNNLKSKEGFTIIEVVLVLAIAGLIFLMVFIAFPGLQRGQRDTQRRNDMSRFLSQLSQYQTNNRGQVPADKSGYENFITNYLTLNGTDTFEDPSTGSTYAIKGYVIDCTNSLECTSNPPAFDGAVGEIKIYKNAMCDGENVVKVDGTRKIAIRTKLEGAGIYCGNN